MAVEKDESGVWVATEDGEEMLFLFSVSVLLTPIGMLCCALMNRQLDSGAH